MLIDIFNLKHDTKLFQSITRKMIPVHSARIEARLILGKLLVRKIKIPAAISRTAQVTDIHF